MELTLQSTCLGSIVLVWHINIEDELSVLEFHS